MLFISGIIVCIDDEFRKCYLIVVLLFALMYRFSYLYSHVIINSYREQSCYSVGY